MNNFEFSCPTKIIFGIDTIKKIRDEISHDKKILITYGGGSIRKNGVLKQVKEALEGFNYSEFGGIEPNPKFETLMEAVKVVKVGSYDFLLAVGGGSVLDGTKFIAAASKFEGDPWDILIKGAPVNDAVELASVMTLPATGSEMNCGAVISRLSTKEKFAFMSEKVYPKFSVIDPQTTYSLPEKQTVNGIVDTYTHVMEQYATYDVNTPLQDQWALGIIKTLIEEGPKVLREPQNYDARANIFWCATCGLNYWISLGAVQDWSTHMIGHELTALYGLDHGETLAIILPSLWRTMKKDKMEKLAKMAIEVFGANEFLPKSLLADITIKKTEKFFNKLGRKTRLKEYGINPKEAAAEIKKRFSQRNTVLGERGNITADVAYEIVTNA